MSDEVTFFLVGEEEIGKMELINAFINNSERIFNKKLENFFGSAQIKIQNRNILLNIHKVGSNVSHFKNMQPSAILFVYDIANKKSFEALNSWLEKVQKVFPSDFQNIKKVLVGNNSDKFEDEQVTEEDINEFKNKINASSFKVNTSQISLLDNLFIETTKNILGISGEDYIPCSEPNNEGFSKPGKSYNIVILLVGEKETEKSKIINAFTKKENSVSYGSKIIQVNNKNFEISLHEASSDISFLKNDLLIKPSAVLLIYDITKEETYKALKDRWYPEVKELFPDAIKVIVGNNSDKYELEQVNEEEAREYAESIKAYFYLISVEKNDNINKLFIEIANKVVNGENFFGKNLIDGKNQIDRVNENQFNEIPEIEDEVEIRDVKKCCCFIV